MDLIQPFQKFKISLNVSSSHFESKKVVELDVRSNNNNIFYTVAYHAMYEIISRNRNLVEKRCTLDNLYPFEVAVGVLYLSHSSTKNQYDDRTIKVLYHYLKEVTWHGYLKST